MHEDIDMIEKRCAKGRKRSVPQSDRPEKEKSVDVHSVGGEAEYSFPDKGSEAAGFVEVVDAESPAEGEVSCHGIEKVKRGKKEEKSESSEHDEATRDGVSIRYGKEKDGGSSQSSDQSKAEGVDWKCPASHKAGEQTGMKLCPPAEPYIDLVEDGSSHRNPQPGESTDAPQAARPHSVELAEKYHTHEENPETQGMNPLFFQDQLQRVHTSILRSMEKSWRQSRCLEK